MVPSTAHGATRTNEKTQPVRLQRGRITKIYHYEKDCALNLVKTDLNHGFSCSRMLSVRGFAILIKGQPAWHQHHLGFGTRYISATAGLTVMKVPLFRYPIRGISIPSNPRTTTISPPGDRGVRSVIDSFGLGKPRMAPGRSTQPQLSLHLPSTHATRRHRTSQSSE